MIGSMKWTTQDMERQDGRTFVVTGANSGIGLEAARALGAAGARVVVACRDIAKGEHAVAELDGDFDVRRLDLADLSSVRAFASELDGDVDVLINNAGVMAVPRSTTADGFETQLGNHLFAQSAAMGALPTLYAATEDIPGGSYVGPDGVLEQRGHPQLVGMSGAARDEESARRLWEVSEELTGVAYDFAAVRV